MKKPAAKESAPATSVADFILCPDPDVVFFSTGSTLLDCVLSGGYPQGRVVNIVGDEATGKTLLCIEAAANFAVQFPKGKIHYAEAEAAFDLGYAKMLGLPGDRVNFIQDCFTVEDMFDAMVKVLEENKDEDEPGLFILDSLDALSDVAESERNMADPSFGSSKARLMSELFRRMAKHLAQSKVTVLIVSQLRENIGVRFGDKKRRSGGKALDFYATQVIRLTRIKQIQRQRQGRKRIVGVIVKAKCTKNKVGLPFRECQFPLLFYYGIDDVTANLEWLVQENGLDAVDMTKADVDKILKALDNLELDAFLELRDRVEVAVRELWTNIEQGFMPPRSKYSSGDEDDG